MGATTRCRLLGTIFLLFFWTAAVPGGRAEPLQLQRVTIRVYDHAGIPEHVLSRAQVELVRLFHRMDLGVDVVLCFRGDRLLETTCNLPPQANEFHLAIVADVPREVSGKKVAPETCGFALLTGNSLDDKRANVFYSCVKRTAEETQMSPGIVLGHLIAHEMGHLLLNTKRHSPEGIFRARIRPEDWRLAAQGRLEFSGMEITRLRAAVAARLRAPATFELAGSPAGARGTEPEPASPQRQD